MVGLDGTHVTLKSNALVDGKGKDDVAAGVEGLDENIEVLLLRDPCFLFVMSVIDTTAVSSPRSSQNLSLDCLEAETTILM